MGSLVVRRMVLFCSWHCICFPEMESSLLGSWIPGNCMTLNIVVCPGTAIFRTEAALRFKVKLCWADHKFQKTEMQWNKWWLIWMFISRLVCLNRIPLSLPKHLSCRTIIGCRKTTSRLSRRNSFCSTKSVFSWKLLQRHKNRL